LHKILSCVIVPDERKAFGWKKGKYNGERHQEISEAIRDKMSIKYAYPIALFFWTISHELIATMKDYGSSQLVKAQEILKEVEKDLWYVTLDNLSNGCPEKWEYYYDMKLIEFLNLLLYYKDKEEYYEKLRQLNDFKARR
jgi:hypothetical protein